MASPLKDGSVSILTHTSLVITEEPVKRHQNLRPC